MQIRTYIMILFLLSLGSYCYGQRFVAMDVSRIIGFKRIKYYIGDDIRYKDAETNKRYKGKIVALSDSLIFFENKSFVNIKDIKVVYRDNANFVTRGLGRFCLLFGPGFLGLDTFNNIINKRKPIINDLAVQEGAAFVGAGLILDNMMKRRYKIGKRRSIKIMDLDMK